MSERSALTGAADAAVALLAEFATAPGPEPHVEEIGTVEEVGDGVAFVTDLGRTLADELVIFASGEIGVVSDLELDRLGVILLGDAERIAVGDDVRRSRSVVSVPVGEALLSRVVDALGRPRDGRGKVAAAKSTPIEADAPRILDRAPVKRPLATGIKAIDAAVPIGCGQRELIIGDRQTGKTSIAIDAMLNQKDTGVICIYCAIGQRGDAVARVIAALREGGMMGQSVVVVAGGEEGPGLSFIAPYAATAMAEYFAHKGQDVLIIYDDLTRHARTCRELSLLLRHPPGREAYPGDIFYTHARLLERSAQLSAAQGGGSITALPIVETQAENLSAYIPTNLISITDGQIYLSPRLVRKGQFPAVDLGKSVSRVGGKAQAPAFRAVAGDVRITLSQFEELESFARFGTRLDDDTRARLARGAAVRAALLQPERDPITAPEQLTMLLAAMSGHLDKVPAARMPAAMSALRGAARSGLGAITKRIVAGAPLEEGDRAAILDLALRALTEAGVNANA
jgi:F-type H+-transporting ATPase subunit alpha